MIKNRKKPRTWNFPVSLLPSAVEVLHYHFEIILEINVSVAAFPVPNHVTELHVIQNNLFVVMYSSERKNFESL
jgi:hypothetical protein